MTVATVGFELTSPQSPIGIRGPAQSLDYVLHVSNLEPAGLEWSERGALTRPWPGLHRRDRREAVHTNAWRDLEPGAV